MRSANDIVEDIRQSLAGSGEMGPDRNRLAMLAGEYAACVRDLLRRSRECRELLVQGQRSEAIAVAKQGVDLKEQHAGLDFDEMGAWLDVTEQFNLDIPPLVDMSVETVIQDIYVTSSSFDKLILGYRSVRDMLNTPDVTVTGDAVPMLQALFPRDTAFMWKSDHF